jgi:uncharacterized protein YaeQ
MMAKTRWAKHAEEILQNPPPLSDANRVANFLRERKGRISHIIDIAEPHTKEVTTWVLRFSVKGRCDQFDLYRNGVFILTGGRKKCNKAMTPEYFPILRYD